MIYVQKPHHPYIPPAALGHQQVGFQQFDNELAYGVGFVPSVILSPSVMLSRKYIVSEISHSLIVSWERWEVHGDEGATFQLIVEKFITKHPRNVFSIATLCIKKWMFLLWYRLPVVIDSSYDA